jgi:lysophospholipase L1-like esterase
MAAAFVAAALGAGAEIYARAVADTGFDFDLEMWKYARDLKRVSPDPAIGHEHRPGAAAGLMGVEVRINSQGLRDREYAYDRAPGVARVAMLGDSLTLGWGVALDDTWSKRLERMFAGEGRGVEVLNFGVGNYNTAQEVSAFLKEGAKYRPDVVVLNYFINDAEPAPRYRDFGFVERNSYAYVYFKGRWDVFRRMTGTAEDWRAYYRTLYAGAAQGWGEARRGLDRLAAYCKANGIRLLLVHHPELRQLKDYPFADVTERLRAWAAGAEVPFLDLTPAMAGAEPVSLWVTRPDPHPSAKAHDIAARAMFPVLRSLLPPPPAARP